MPRFAPLRPVATFHVVMVLLPDMTIPVPVRMPGAGPKDRNRGVNHVARAIRQMNPGQDYLRAGKDPELGWRFREAQSGGAFVYGWIAS